MWYWWFMFCCDILAPLLMITMGRMMWKHCPEEINSIIGYRTKRSMKNLDTWKFAHEYCGRLWWIIGWIILLPSILVQIPFYHGTDNLIGIVGLIICMAQCIIMLLSIIPVEKALKKTFNEDGTRR